MLAHIRGDADDERVFTRAGALVRDRDIQSDTDLGSLLVNPPPDAHTDVLKPLRHVFEAGAWVLFESALVDLPADLRWLYESGAVTIEQLAAVYDELTVTSLADLAAAVQQQAIRSVIGLDENVESAVAAALKNVRQTLRRIPLGRAVALADPFLLDLQSLPGTKWAVPVGSLRRAQDTVGDVELMAATDQPATALDAVAHHSNVDRVLHQSPRRVYVLADRTQVGVRLPDPANAGPALLYLTGSPRHFVALRARAEQRNWRLTAESLTAPNGAHRMASTEEEIYDALDLPFIPPEIRDGDDEIAAAEGGTLPRLIEQKDIRGDLHMHSNWSDGRDSVELMVETCRELGYDYIALTDHSPYSGASRTLSPADVRRQADEIASLRERFPEMTILHGCEVDILPNGRLDFPDRVLEQLDIVLASLHHRSGDGPDKLLSRYVSAMRHPLVTLITHPTNRLVPHRAGYDLDYDRLFAAAVETGTLLEIDGAPAHLDLEGRLAKRAVAAGATVAVNSDCHRWDLLQRQMRLGVMTARRGWIEPRHVFNTRTIAEVRTLIARKRATT